MTTETQDLLEDAERLQRLLSALRQWRMNLDLTPRGPCCTDDRFAEGMKAAERQISRIVQTTAPTRRLGHVQTPETPREQRPAR
jgi:hypothetical protein